MNKSVAELIHSGFISENQFSAAQEALKANVEETASLSEKLGCLFRKPSQWDRRSQSDQINDFPDVLYSGDPTDPVSLMERMPPVEKQKQHFPSPAAAVTMLLEYLSPNKKEKLSEEFLYRKCKETDKFQAPGTLLETALNCAEKFGTCRADLVRKLTASEKEQAAKSGKLLEDAQKHRLTCKYQKLEHVDDIDQYRKLLSSGSGMPILVGIDVFKSWYCSGFTRDSGWLSLPLPYDKRLGGAAMLIVGYCDSKYVAGGGYFSVRTPWGRDWAAKSDSPGYAKIPYAYIANYTRYAAAVVPGQNGVQSSVQKTVPDAPKKTEAADEKVRKEDFISEEQYEEAVKAVSRNDGEYAPAGKTGCRIDEDGCGTKAYARYTGYRNGVDYPSEVSLVPQMPPVYKQGERGTCAAMTITALAEYYEGCREKLSPQYLYCKCKELEYKMFQTELSVLLHENDQAGELGVRLEGIFDVLIRREIPKDAVNGLRAMVGAALQEKGKTGKVAVFSALSNAYISSDPGGTDLRIAMNCLDENGICAYDVWPYQPEPIPGNEGQFVSYPDVCAPEDAEKDARKHRLRDDFKMIFPPNSVDAYKAVLSGANGNRPMPVAIGARTFASWLGSPFAKKTGWVSMPLPNDKETGAHAMLVVGYKDSPNVPGGGYFIVRNSWGKDWAFGSQYPGYAKMPYKYVTNFVKQAATIVQRREDAPAAERSMQDNALEKYLGIADRDMKNGKGIWAIAKGSRIITDPGTGVSEPDTAENREIFRRNNFSWVKSAEKSGTNCPERLDPSLNRAVGIKNDFCANLDANLCDRSSTYCFPGIDLPLSARLKPWQIRVKKVRMREDITEDWVKAQVNAGLLLPEEQEKAMLCNTFRIYELSNGSVLFRVAAVFISPITEGKLAGKVENQSVDCAKKLLRDYIDHLRYSPASATFCVMGTASSFSKETKAAMSHNLIEIFAQRPDADFPWEIQFPSVKATPVWYSFITHLLPLNAADRLEVIREAVERTINQQVGTRSLKKIAEECHWPEEMVWPEIVRLCEGGDYKFVDGEVIRADGVKQKPLIFPGRRILYSCVFGYYNNFVSALLFAAGWKLLVRPDMSNRYQIGTIAGLALFSFLASCLSAERLRAVVNKGKVN